MLKKIIVAKNAEAEIIEKKSKFIAYCGHVSNQDEAQAFIDSIKKKNWNATHNVYAYQIGINGELQRSSDDGEPSGTAGRPVLEVIKGSGLSDIIVVVTRYFGGILLGTGGLVRAYSKAAQAALDVAEKEQLFEGKTVCLFLDYENLGKVENYLIREQIAIDHIEYKNNAAIFCLIPCGEEDEFLNKLQDTFPHGINYTVAQETKWLSSPLN